MMKVKLFSINVSVKLACCHAESHQLLRFDVFVSSALVFIFCNFKCRQLIGHVSNHIYPDDEFR